MGRRGGAMYRHSAQAEHLHVPLVRIEAFEQICKQSSDRKQKEGDAMTVLVCFTFVADILIHIT
jgi:hypothetical protein